MNRPAAADSPSPAAPGTARPPLITLRAILIGSFLTAGTAALTPWNDYVVYNTLTTGGYFPLAVALSLFVLVLLVNAPLHALRPRSVLRTSELAVILSMLLVGCAIPGQGLMRTLLPGLVSPFRFHGTDPAFAQAWRDAQVPGWLFPVDPALGHLDTVVTEFYGRTPPGKTPPYTRWILPLLVWSVFLTGLYITLLAMASLLRQQWAHNERLAFPIAQLESALIAAPQPGRWVNDLLGSRTFWIACSAVFLVHLINGLNVYFPRYVPQIPLTYNLAPVLTKEPLSYLHWQIKSSTLYFSIVGFMYFIPGRIGFSLFAVWLTLQGIALTGQVSFGTTVSQGAYNDQHFGAAVAFLFSVIWVGRRYWATVTRHVFVGPARGENVSYRRPALWFAVGLAIMFGWMIVVGMKPTYAVVAIGMALLSNLVVARVVAETGLPIFRTTLTPSVITSNLPATALTGRDMYFSGVFGQVGGAYSTRESSLGLALHGHRVFDELEPRPRERSGLIALMALSIVIAFVASTSSALWCYYNYATPISSRSALPVINDHLLLTVPRMEVVDPMMQHAQGAFAAKSHNAYLHMAIGFIVMAGLQVASWSTAMWPIAPIGYLAGTTWYVSIVWWSIAVGWLLKALVVHFGGAPLYRAARPAFVGLVFGECLAALLWLLVSLFMALIGQDYIVIRLMPT